MSDADAGALRETYHDLSEPERFVAAFERAAAVRHPAIAAPLAWGRTSDNRVHCAFARAETVELRPGTLSPSDVALLGVHLTRALTLIHGAGLVHGGISTASIVQSREHGVQLLGFGLFSALSDGGLGVQAAALRIAGPAYVSPEVQRGSGPDPRSDVFSLGASLYELLTGKPPYGGRTTSFVMASVLSNQEGATDISNDAIAGPVIEALLRAIENDPDDRWPSAAAFGRALAIAAGSAELAVVRPAQSPPQSGWFRAILSRWFPARRSRME